MTAAHAQAEIDVSEVHERHLVGRAASSPAGPLAAEDAALPGPPRVPLPRLAQVLQLSQRQIVIVPVYLGRCRPGTIR